MQKVCFLILLVIGISSCQKEPNIIPGNTAPFDGTVSNQTKKNYIQKVYLATLGIMPSDSEATAAFNIVSKNNCSVENRQELLDILYAKSAFKANLYDCENNDLLDGTTSTDIDQIINSIQTALNSSGPNADTIGLRTELNEMILLRDAKSQFIAGQISLMEVQRRMVESTSFYYVNGDGDSWINAVYTIFLLRDPTLDEVEQITYMLNNMPGILFLQNGISREDVINIIFNNYSFAEGQVRKLYKKQLYREPTINEIQRLVPQYRSSNDIKSLLNQILISNEYLNL